MDLDKLKDLGDEKVMKDYIKEAEAVSFEDGFGEAYDKEWALKDEGKTEGRLEGKRDKTIEIAKKMLDKKMDILLISDLTGLTKDEITALEEE